MRRLFALFGNAAREICRNEPKSISIPQADKRVHFNSKHQETEYTVAWSIWSINKLLPIPIASWRTPMARKAANCRHLRHIDQVYLILPGREFLHPSKKSDVNFFYQLTARRCGGHPKSLRLGKTVVQIGCTHRHLLWRQDFLSSCGLSLNRAKKFPENIKVGLFFPSYNTGRSLIFIVSCSYMSTYVYAQGHLEKHRRPWICVYKWWPSCRTSTYTSSVCFTSRKQKLARFLANRIKDKKPKI